MTPTTSSARSVDHTTPGDASFNWDPTSAWRLHPRVSLRPEPFGALAYHYGNRRLNFLRHPDLVRIVETLDQYDSISDALHGEKIAASRHPAFTKALAALAASDFLEPR